MRQIKKDSPFVDVVESRFTSRAQQSTCQVWVCLGLPGTDTRPSRWLIPGPEVGAPSHPPSWWSSWLTWARSAWWSPTASTWSSRSMKALRSVERTGRDSRGSVLAWPQSPSSSASPSWSVSTSMCTSSTHSRTGPRRNLKNPCICGGERSSRLSAG